MSLIENPPSIQRLGLTMMIPTASGFLEASAARDNSLYGIGLAFGTGIIAEVLISEHNVATLSREIRHRASRLYTLGGYALQHGSGSSISRCNGGK